MRKGRQTASCIHGLLGEGQVETGGEAAGDAVLHAGLSDLAEIIAVMDGSGSPEPGVLLCFFQ